MDESSQTEWSTSCQPRRPPLSSLRSPLRSVRRLTPCATTATVPTVAAVLATGAGPITPLRRIRRAQVASHSLSFQFVGCFDRCQHRLNGMRPLATSWPPAWRTAAPKGAAHLFSHTSTPAELPGSTAAATAPTSSSLRSIASSPSCDRRPPISPSSRSDSSYASSVPSGSFLRTSRSRIRIRSRSTRSTRAGAMLAVLLTIALATPAVAGGQRHTRTDPDDSPSILDI